MKRTLAFVTAICCASILLGGCSSKNKDTYFNIDSDFQIQDSELSEKLEQSATPLNTVVTDYKQHEKEKIMASPATRCTFDDEFLYIYNGLGYTPMDSYNSQIIQYYKINLQSGEILSLCDIPGCTHDYNYNPDCINFQQIDNPTAVGDVIWRTEQNKLFEINGNEKTVLFENSYCTEFEKKYSVSPWWKKYGFSALLVDDYIYAFGGSYTFRMNKKTMKPEKYINITDDAYIITYVVYNSKAYVLNMIEELFVVDYETGTATKLDDKVSGFDVYNDVLYYTRWNDGYPILYSANLDGSEEKQLAEDCSFDFMINDGKLFYYNTAAAGHALHSYDLSTGEDITIYDGFFDCLYIVTADHIDRIFAVGTVYKSSSEVMADENPGEYSVIVSVRTDGSDLWIKEVDGKDIVM